MASLEHRPDQERRPRKVYLPSSRLPALERPPAAFRGPRERRLPSSRFTGERLRPSNFWVIWETARRRAGLTWVRFHDLRHFAATMFASTGASTKEIMSRGGWKSVAMVVRYEHASEERDALLARRSIPTQGAANVVPIASESEEDRARARTRRRNGRQ